MQFEYFARKRRGKKTITNKTCAIKVKFENIGIQSKQWRDRQNKITIATRQFALIQNIYSLIGKNPLSIC